MIRLTMILAVAALAAACVPDEELAVTPPPAEPTPDPFAVPDPNAKALEPRVVTFEARRLRELDPSIERVQVTTDYDVSGIPGRAFHNRVSVRALGAGCGADGRLIFAYSSAAPDDALLPSDAIQRALASDLIASTRGASCRPPALAPFGGGGGGGGGFWGQVPCADYQDEFDASDAALLASLLVLDLVAPSWPQLCDAHTEPAEVTACKGLVTAIRADLTAARASRTVASDVVGHAMNLTYDAMDIAEEIDLGVNGALQQNPAQVAELATIMVLVRLLEGVATTQAGMVVDFLSSAIGTASIDPLLEPISLEITPVQVIAQDWRSDVDAVMACYRRVTTWIAVGAAIGFGVRILFLPNVKGPGIADGFLPPPPPGWSSSLVTGFYNPQRMSHYPTHPIVVSIDALTSLESAATRSESGGYVTRTIWAGYDQPTAVIPADIYAPHPVFLYPVLAVPAGSTIRLAPTPSLNPGFMPDFTISGNQITMTGVGVPLHWNETDAAGNPTSDLWATCADGPINGEYCSLAIDSTGSPAQIAAGHVFTRHWRIHATGGIIDPVTGYPMELMSGYLVHLSARAERPTSPCYVWDGTRYVWDHLLPGCGPITPPGGGL